MQLEALFISYALHLKILYQSLNPKFMKKLVTLITLLLVIATTATADELVASKTWPWQGKPEKIYRMTSGANISVGGDACPGSIGEFAFYAVDGVENAYYIYSVTEDVWFNYAIKSTPEDYSLSDNFVILSNEPIYYFHFEKCETYSDFYQIRPYAYNGHLPELYLNFWNGEYANPEYRLGLWNNPGDYDKGSRYFLAEVGTNRITKLEDFNPYKCYTMTTQRGAWTVSGDEFKCTNNANEEPSKDNINQHFAVLTADGENYYLFSVATQKFVYHKSTYAGGLVASAGDPIVLHDASAYGTNRFMVQFKDKELYFNINGENNTAINDWKTIDSGNAILFTEVGNFNPSAAYQILNTPSGIETPLPDNTSSTTNNTTKGIYDLMGRKLKNITTPGVYIVDGRKQIMK